MTGTPGVPTPGPSTSVPLSAEPTQPTVPPSQPVDPCGPHGLLCGPYRFVVESGLPFTPPVPCSADGATCELALDVYHPTAKPASIDRPGAQPAGAPPGGWPLVVAIPGGPLPPGSRGALSVFAAPLAMQGAVVVAADYRSSPQYGGGYPQTFADVACAVRRAREIAPTYGANPDRVTLVSHSFGGWPASVVALSPERYRLGASNCLAVSGAPTPEAYVGVASIHTLEGIGPDFLASLLGGTRDQQPAKWDAVDPIRILDAGLGRDIPVGVVTGALDLVVTVEETAPFVDALRRTGYRATNDVIDTADHTTVLVHPTTFERILGRAPITTGFP